MSAVGGFFWWHRQVARLRRWSAARLVSGLVFMYTFLTPTSLSIINMVDLDITSPVILASFLPSFLPFVHPFYLSVLLPLLMRSCNSTKTQQERLRNKRERIKRRRGMWRWEGDRRGRWVGDVRDVRDGMKKRVG